MTLGIHQEVWVMTELTVVLNTCCGGFQKTPYPCWCQPVASHSTNFFLCNSCLKLLTNCSGLKMTKLGPWNFQFLIAERIDCLLRFMRLTYKKILWCASGRVCPKKRLASFLPFPRSPHFVLQGDWVAWSPFECDLQDKKAASKR